MYKRQPLGAAKKKREYEFKLPSELIDNQWEQGVLRIKVAPYPRAGYTLLLRGVEISGDFSKSTMEAWERAGGLWDAL